jgi:hypothetical protein
MFLEDEDGQTIDCCACQSVPAIVWKASWAGPCTLAYCKECARQGAEPLEAAIAWSHGIFGLCMDYVVVHEGEYMTLRQFTDLYPEEFNRLSRIG